MNKLPVSNVDLILTDFIDCVEKAFGDDILMEEEYDDNPYVQQQIGTQVGIKLVGKE